MQRRAESRGRVWCHGQGLADAYGNRVHCGGHSPRLVNHTAGQSAGAAHGRVTPTSRMRRRGPSSAEKILTPGLSPWLCYRERWDRDAG